MAIRTSDRPPAVAFIGRSRPRPHSAAGRSRPFARRTEPSRTPGVAHPSEEVPDTHPSGSSSQCSYVSRSSGAISFRSDPFYETVVESPAIGVRQRAYPQVTVVTDPTRTRATTDAVGEYLRTDSDAARLTPADAELVVRTGGDFVEQVGDVIERVTRFVPGIAGIALVVGAIGIANVMLVSVAERTREIGVTKAVGARNRDVMLLFLVEAGLLGAVGAIVGLAAGFAATRYAEVGFTVAPGWMALAVAVGVLVGVGSGLYPAWRAARVDPIDALRYE